MATWNDDRPGLYEYMTPREAEALRRAYLVNGDQLAALEAEARWHNRARPRVVARARARLYRAQRARTTPP